MTTRILHKLINSLFIPLTRFFCESFDKSQGLGKTPQTMTIVFDLLWIYVIRLLYKLEISPTSNLESWSLVPTKWIVYLKLTLLVWLDVLFCILVTEAPENTCMMVWLRLVMCFGMLSDSIVTVKGLRGRIKITSVIFHNLSFEKLITSVQSRTSNILLTSLHVTELIQILHLIYKQRNSLPFSGHATNINYHFCLLN